MAFKYHKQYRLPAFNYAAAGFYFVTICTHNRECYFGDIAFNEMRLSAIGKIAADCWRDIPNHFDFVSLDEWCVQPNHTHGIIIINGNDNQPAGRNAINRVPTNGGFAGDNNPMFHNSLGRIIRWFKGRTSFECHKLNLDFHWQPRFHDHIIRTEQSLQQIRKYIKYNHLKWKQDIFYQI